MNHPIHPPPPIGPREGPKLMYPPRPREELAANVVIGCFVAILLIMGIYGAFHPEALRPTMPRANGASSVQRCTP